MSEIEQEQQQDSRDFANLRRSHDAVAAERDAIAAERDGFKKQLLDNAITAAGFDPTLGIVQRLAADFQGDLTADAFKVFATAEGLTPAASTATTATAEHTETEQQLDTLQTAGDRLRDASHLPTAATDIDKQIEAEALLAESGDQGAVLRLMRLKNQKLSAAV